MLLGVSEDGLVEASMLKGYAYAESRAGASRVIARNTLSIRREENADLAPIGSPDEWEQWNIDGDRRLTAWSDSSRYLTDELHAYSSDFDDSGRWQYASGYGYVWTPTMVAADWAPYTVGSWIWSVVSTYGSPMTPGAGSPATMAAGCTSPPTAGPGRRRQGALRTGRPATRAGS